MQAYSSTLLNAPTLLAMQVSWEVNNIADWNKAVNTGVSEMKILSEFPLFATSLQGLALILYKDIEI